MRKEKRIHRMEEALRVLESGDVEVGFLFAKLAELEAGLGEVTEDEEKGLLQRVASLGFLGDVDEEGLLPGLQLGALASRLRPNSKARRSLTAVQLAFALNREFGASIPLEKILGKFPWVPADLTEELVLLPFALGVTVAYQLRNEPRRLERRQRWLRRRIERLRARG